MMYLLWSVVLYQYDYGTHVLSPLLNTVSSPHQPQYSQHSPQTCQHTHSCPQTEELLIKYTLLCCFLQASGLNQKILLPSKLYNIGS